MQAMIKLRPPSIRFFPYALGLVLAAGVILSGQALAHHSNHGGISIPASTKPITAASLWRWHANNYNECNAQSSRDAATCYFKLKGYIPNHINYEGPPFYLEPGSRNSEIWAVKHRTRPGIYATHQIRKLYLCPKGSSVGEIWNTSGSHWGYYPTVDNKPWDPVDHVEFCVVTGTLAKKDKTIGKQCGIGNPCDPATGNKIQVETDFRGPGLTFTRYYNSQIQEGRTRPALGARWRHNFERYLVVEGVSLVSVARARRPNGQLIEFTQLSGGAWIPDADLTETFTDTANGYTLTQADGTEERYDPSGRLTAIVQSNGQSETYQYDTEGRLSQVTGPFGHALGFGYNTEHFLETVTLPDNTTLTYQYDIDNNLKEVIYPDETPGDNTDNPKRIYHYEDPNFPDFLTGITDENGDRFATFAYDANGRAQSTEHAVTDNAGPQEKFTLGYQ